MPAKPKIRVAINGFGRIGRAAFKIALTRKRLEVVAINDLTDARTLAHLLKYDSIYGTYKGSVRAKASAIVVKGREYPILAEANPVKLPWKKCKVDVVLECTGRFVKDNAAAVHLKAGAKRVIISAPAKGKGDVPTYLIGVNEKKYRKSKKVISNASCTTNCIAPVAKILQDRFGIKTAMMTTVHSYTADQRLHDAPHHDLRRARAAAHNIVPTSTGATLATAEAIPELRGLFTGLAIRVPTINVSLADLTFILKKKTTAEEVNSVFTEEAQSPQYDGVLGVTDQPLVSSDFIGDPRSSIVDLALTQVVGGDMVKVIAWYDNEWGYSQRLVEMAELIM